MAVGKTNNQYYSGRIEFAPGHIPGQIFWQQGRFFQFNLSNQSFLILNRNNAGLFVR